MEGSSRAFDLSYRGQIEYLDVPPGRTCSVDIRLIQPAPPRGPMPDMAIGREDVNLTAGTGEKVEVRIRVHNIGSADAGPANVAIFANAPGSKPLAEAAVPPIPAPNDLLAKFQDARVEVQRAALAGGWRVEVRSGPDAQDSNPLNNTRSGRLPVVREP